MITQKQIDTRNMFIKRLHSLGVKSAFIAFDELRQMQQEIADADKEAAEMKDEILDAVLNHLYHERKTNGCAVMLAHNSFVRFVERATGLTIDEAIKAWEERNK